MENQIKLKNEIVIEENKIEDYEPDIERRQVLYPNVYKIELIKQLYEDSQGNEIVKTIERQFSKLKIRPQVSKLVGKLNKKSLNENERIIYMEEPIKNRLGNEVDIGGYQPIYIPSFSKYDSIVNKKIEKMEIYEIDKSKVEDIKEPDGYLPPDVKTGENVSIVVKEIPNYLTLLEIKKTLREMFEPYGMISNINVLTKFNDGQKTNIPIGLAFIDFCYKEDVDKLLKSNERFKISNSILKLELANGKR
jgi:hypothetical protein